MKETPTAWWKSESAANLSEVVSFVNEARPETDQSSSFDFLAKAANRLWTQLARYQKRNDLLSEEHRARGRGDTASFEELLHVSICDDAKRRIVESREFVMFVELTPAIMSQDVLRHENYDPVNIPASLRKKASEKHFELVDAVQKYSASKSGQHLNKVVKKLADLLYVIRSNIFHGEKTPKGPDLDKAQRDQQVCERALPVMEMIFREVFDEPDQRLVVYGTLVPGGANHGKLSGIPGTWLDARVSGRITEMGGLSYFTWDLSASEIDVKIFKSEKLKQSWLELDRFEGQSYQRKWVVASIDGIQISIANIYTGRN